MKKSLFICLALCAVLLSSCKKDDWIDWKMQNEFWLEQNIINHEGNPNFHVTESGLQYEVLYQGNITDTKPDALSTVYVNYKGMLINGYQFDQANDASLHISNVVEGFAEGLKKMNKHADYILYIPWNLGYGDGKDKNKDRLGTEGSSSYIPPYSTLIFEVHLVDVIK